jgi:hypothetical protein
MLRRAVRILTTTRTSHLPVTTTSLIIDMSSTLLTYETGIQSLTSVIEFIVVFKDDVSKEEVEAQAKAIEAAG